MDIAAAVSSSTSDGSFFAGLSAATVLVTSRPISLYAKYNMMSDAIIVALISACATVLAQLAINAQNKKEMSITQAVRDKDIDDRLKVIEEKLESHNSYSKLFTEYTAKNNEVIVAIQKDIEYLKEK